MQPIHEFGATVPTLLEQVHEHVAPIPALMDPIRQKVAQVPTAQVALTPFLFLFLCGGWRCRHAEKERKGDECEY
jgi:hypothetical protein